MRTLDEIYNELLEQKATYTDLEGLSSTSKTAIWRLFLWIFAYAIFVHEQIFENTKTEINTALNEDKAHTARWYRTMALKFQYGFDLIEDDYNFNNSNATEDEIDASKIIKYCAVTESTGTDAEGLLIVKIATESAGELQPITEEQKEAFRYYFNEYRDAGVRFNIINYLPDRLVLKLQIKRNPNVLDRNGVSILNGDEPVKEVLQKFMKNLTFNGEFYINKMIDALQNIEGVEDPFLLSAQTAWIDEASGGYGELEDIFTSKVAESGYFKIDWLNSEITYVV